MHIVFSYIKKVFYLYKRPPFTKALIKLSKGGNYYAFLAFTYIATLYKNTQSNKYITILRYVASGVSTQASANTSTPTMRSTALNKEPIAPPSYETGGNCTTLSEAKICQRFYLFVLFCTKYAIKPPISNGVLISIGK